MDGEYYPSDYLDKFIGGHFSGVNIEEPNHGSETLHSLTGYVSLSHQLQPGDLLISEIFQNRVVLNKYSFSEKANLTYLSAASTASVAMEFTDEENVDELPVVCATRMKTSENGDSIQLVHSALDTSSRVLTRLQIL
ncbi:hypothetical protein EWB00_005915 [Schistosoma japonicum]|uniref:Uncharacterized protein n=1 Tax=Schistosoma japonicum TaxID=6182 RepID=A0A4Z2D059_SCHJA|nr:hypothetical protein EWB00_005915 [Schistosoma japonicum]